MIYVLLGSVTGLLIGMVGIGGILLAPMLVYIAGMDLHLAMATSSWSFLFTGIAGVVAYARRGTISWTVVSWLTLGIIPATIVGAKVNLSLNTNILTFILAVLIVSSGIHAFIKKPPPKQNSSRSNRFILVLIGIVTGFGSALTGTGGPVLLMPILMFFSLPTLVAIGVSQAIQLPIAIFASVGYSLYGQIDIELGALLGLIQAIGVLVGAQIAHRVSARQLKKIVAGALVLVGMFMIGREILWS